MPKNNKPKEGIDYAKANKLTKEIAKRLKEIRELYLREYPQGDYMNLTIWKDSILFRNSCWDDDIGFPIDYSEWL